MKPLNNITQELEQFDKLIEAFKGIAETKKNVITHHGEEYIVMPTETLSKIIDATMQVSLSCWKAVDLIETKG